MVTIVTVAEAARMYGVNRRSVLRAIESSHKPLQARKSGDTWLITLESLKKRWNEPKHPVDTSTLAYPI